MIPDEGGRIVRLPVSPEAERDRVLDETLQRGYRYALSLTHDDARAQDLLQDAILGLLHRRAEMSVPLLVTAIRNRFIDAHRKEMRAPMVPLDVDALPAPDAPEPVEREALDRALATLRPDEREVLYLTYAEDCTAQQIADLSRRPRGTILSLLHRARLKLRALLGGEEQEARE